MRIPLFRTEDCNPQSAALLLPYMVGREMRMSEQANVSKLQEMYAAFSRGDVDTILRNVTDDCDWGTESVISAAVPWYIVRHGREGVGDFFSTLASEVDFQSFVPSVF